MKYKQKKAIKDFIKEINPDIKVVFNSDYVESNPYDQIVYVNELPYDYDAQMFMDFFRKDFKACVNADYITITLLHEVGHIETLDDNEFDNREVIVELLTLAFESGDISLEELNQAYFHLPCEYLATEWAATYYINNLEKIKNFHKKLLT